MATIAINLDDHATEGLATLNRTLTDTAEVSEQAATATGNLTAEQTHQITIINKQSASFSQFATVAAPAFADVSVAAIGLSRDLIHVAHAGQEFAFKTGTQVIGSLLRMAETTVKYTLVAAGAVKVIEAVKGKHAEAAEATEQHQQSLIGLAAKTSLVGATYLTLTGQWQSGGQAAAVAGGLALKAVTALGAPMIGATVALTAYEAILARTGERWDEFGQKTSNLDRVSKSINSLTSEVGSNVAAGVAGLPEYYSRLLGIGEAWRQIDVSVSRGNDNMVANVGHVRSLAEWLGFAAKSTDEFDAKVKRTADDFERLGQITRRWGESDVISERTRQATAFAEKLGDLGHHVTHEGNIEKNTGRELLQSTIARIDEEMRKRHEAAGEASRNNRFTKAEAEKFEAEMTALRAVRAERVREAEQLEKDLPMIRLRENVAAEKQITEQMLQQYDARVKAAEEHYAKRKSIFEEFANHELSLTQDSQDEIMKTVVAKLEAEGANRDVIHAAKLKQIDIETKRKIDAAKTEEEMIRAASDGVRQTMRAEAEFNRDMEVQKIKDKKDAIKESEKLQKEAAAKLAGDLKAAGGPSGEDLLKATDPRQVAKNIQAGRGRAAGTAFAAEHKDEYNAADASGKKRLEAQQRAAVKKAEAQAGRDVRAGKADPREIAAGQNQAAQQTLGAMQKNGALSGDVVKSLSEATRIAAEQQATLGQLQAQVKQIDNYQKSLLGKAKQQRNQAQQGG